jgi:hypothetical protein
MHGSLVEPQWRIEPKQLRWPISPTTTCIFGCPEKNSGIDLVSSANNKWGKAR